MATAAAAPAAATAAGTVKPDVECIFHEGTSTATYVVSCPNTKKAMVLDSVLDYNGAAARTSNEHSDKVLAYAKEKGLTIEWVVDTHVHADHLTGAAYLADQTGATTGIGEHVSAVQKTFKALFNLGEEFKVDGSQFAHLFKDGETFGLGDVQCIVFHTPGHTPACCSFLMGDALFTGDTLFMPDFGTARCDFPGGSATALYESIHDKLYKAVPDDARVFVGHDYKPGGRELKWETTMAAEKEGNKQLKADTTPEEFIKWRSERDAKLGAPRLIIPALQVNLRCGRMPPAESNGTVFLKVPVNVLG